MDPDGDARGSDRSSRPRQTARQLLAADVPAPAVLDALRERIGDAAAIRAMRELLVERGARRDGSVRSARHEQ